MQYDNAKDELLSLPAIESISPWQKGDLDRIYINLAGRNRKFKGCSSTRIYWDNKEGRLVIQEGKGKTTSTFDASLISFLTEAHRLDLLEGPEPEITVQRTRTGLLLAFSVPLNAVNLTVARALELAAQLRDAAQAAAPISGGQEEEAAG